MLFVPFCLVDEFDLKHDMPHANDKSHRQTGRNSTYREYDGTSNHINYEAMHLFHRFVHRIHIYTIALQPSSSFTPILQPATVILVRFRTPSLPRQNKSTSCTQRFKRLRLPDPIERGLRNRGKKRNRQKESTSVAHCATLLICLFKSRIGGGSRIVGK